MTLGEIEKVYDLLDKYFKQKIKKKSFTYQDKFQIYQDFKSHLKESSETVDSRILTDLFDTFFTSSYKFDKKKLSQIPIRHLEADFNVDEIHNIDIIVPKEYKKKYDHFMKLYNTPQPVQRTPEWFKYREQRITASDAATALGEHKYKTCVPERLLIQKCDPTCFPFEDSVACHHGKKYEPIATMVYEHIENVKITEFGCMPHPTVNFLGASPDGICSKSTLDHKFSPLLGRMLEIKCPFSRPIQIDGKVDGGVCPHYYFLQVQLQEECCDLDECDFIQCSITEYDDKHDYLSDKCNDTGHYRGEYTDDSKTKIKSVPIKMNNNILKGCIIQYLPKNKLNDANGFFAAKYLYPPSLNLSTEEYESWILQKLTDTFSLSKKEAEEIEGCVFDKIIYWKLERTHVVLIDRCREWFDETLPKFKEFWDRVEYHREHDDELEIIKQRFTKNRYDTSLMLKSKKFTKEKKLFLEEEKQIDIDFSD
jgi:putative phage-type endonuclease